MLCKCCASFIPLRMATIKAFIRTTKDSEVKIRFRLSDGRKVQLYFISHILVYPSLWDSKKECIKQRAMCQIAYREDVDNKVAYLKDIIMRVYSSHYADIRTSRDLQRMVEDVLNPEDKEEPMVLDEEFADLLAHKNIALGTLRGYEVLKNKLKSFEVFRRRYSPSYSLTLKTMSEDDVRKFLSYIKDVEKIGGANYICTTFKRLRSLFKEMVTLGIINRSPTDNVSVKAERYGTPYYISIAERNRIANYDLSDYPSLEVQRDIFLFQCCIGCRVSDLTRLTTDNIVNGAVEYIPRKTRSEHTDIVRVPLNNSARMLVKKYMGVDKDGRLFPFIADQAYNAAIKRFFTICGITRSVLVYDSSKGCEVRRPINEIASSHLARRTFIGNLYKQVKDPNLVGSMSGHKDGSKAFSRYRNIDDDIKKELVDLLD